MKVTIPSWGIVLAIPAAILASIQLWTLVAPRRAHLIAFQHRDTIGLPTTYLEFLYSVDRVPRKDVTAFVDRVREAQKNVDYQFEILLKALSAFSTSVPIVETRAPDVLMVKIINNGGKAANNVKLFMSVAGFAEINKDGTDVGANTPMAGWTSSRWSHPANTSSNFGHCATFLLMTLGSYMMKV